MRVELVTIPFSHYCEKARWALDRVSVAYHEQGHLPIFSRRATKRIGAGTSVPALVVDSAIVADSTSINVFKTLAAALELRPERRVIVSERSNFPTDLYIAEGLIRQLGRGHILRLVEPNEIDDAINCVGK